VGISAPYWSHGLHSHPEAKQMLAITPNIRSVVDHDGAVILDIPRNAMTTLNSTGAYVWERLTQGVPLASIVTQLSRDTGADEYVVEADVNAFMEDLKSKHLFAAL
jgi:hypothetical protein